MILGSYENYGIKRYAVAQWNHKCNSIELKYYNVSNEHNEPSTISSIDEDIRHGL